MKLSPTSGSALSAQSLLGILSLALSLPVPCSFSLSLSQNKEILKKRKSPVTITLIIIYSSKDYWVKVVGAQGGQRVSAYLPTDYTLAVKEKMFLYT